MSHDKRILETLINITNISNNRKLGFEKKLNHILLEIVNCMQVKRGSIMLFINRKTLEVVATTEPALIGISQNTDVDSPSSWVVRNKRPLYIDSFSSDAPCDLPLVRFKPYRGEAFYLVPIINNNKVIGVVNVTEKVGEDRFNQEEREILLHIVGQVIIALENHRLAESLKKKKKAIEKKNLELVKLEKLRTDLFNMLIHDLKGPVSEIVANLDLLSYTIKDENIEFVEIAQTGCNTLYNMVANLLDISRLEEKKLHFVYEEIEPQNLVREALARLIISGKSKKLQFIENYPDSDGVNLHGDRAILVRVLQNFLTNAIQHSPQGGKITVGCQYAETGKVEVFVQDSGSGVPKEYQELIFDKYKQLDKRTDGRVYTTGLGLAFCKMAIEAHGGKVGVISDGQKGSRFYMII
jgi:two-component system sensor histidine kinase KdpD